MKLLVLSAILLLSAACSGRVLREWPNHGCPVYECEPNDDGTLVGCQAGYTCTIMNCGNICVPDSVLLVRDLARDLGGQVKTLTAKECPELTCDLYCPYGYRTGVDDCPICGCIFVG